MAKANYYDNDGGGRRYELIKSALQGGCPEMLKEMERIIKYIDTGDDSHLIGEAASNLNKAEHDIQKLEKDIAEAIARKERLEQELEEAKALGDELSKAIAEIKQKARGEMNANFLEFQDYFGTKKEGSSSFSDITAKALGDFLQDCTTPYVIIENHVHRVKGVYKHRKKAIIEVSEKGYILTDENANGILQRAEDTRIISISKKLRDLGYSYKW